jgi:hypothetical protein
MTLPRTEMIDGVAGISFVDEVAIKLIESEDSCARRQIRNECRECRKNENSGGDRFSNVPRWHGYQPMVRHSPTFTG